MVKIVYKVTIKQGREEEFKKLAQDVLIPQAKIIKECMSFELFENPTNTSEFIFYEIWKNNDGVVQYYKNLINVLGKNSPGNVFPDKLNDFIEEEEDILHEEA